MFRSITAKFIAWTLTIALFAVASTSYFAYRYASAIIEENASKQAALQMRNIEQAVNLRIVPMQKIPATIAMNLPRNPATLEALMTETLAQNPDVFGVAAAFEPFTYSSSLEYYCPFAYRKDGSVVLKHLGKESYLADDAEWYMLPRKLNSATWSEPYFDPDGDNVLMSTYSYPVRDNGTFTGIVSVDAPLGDIARLITEIRVLQSGYAFLLSRNGQVMVHPDRNLIMKPQRDFFAGKASRADRKNTAELVMRQKAGMAVFSENGRENTMWFKEMDATGWRVGVVFPNDELYAPVHRLSMILLVSSTACGILLLIAIVAVSRSVTHGLRTLTASAGQLASGDLQTPIPPHPENDELGILSRSFESMRESLVQYIENLRISETAKQKIESELSIAREIQHSILPKTFPPFPTRKDIDIFASMRAAREVGGDLYDFYFLDENLLCFIIGDVSGKGVPASLFMAVSKTLLKAVATKHSTPGEILTQVNRELSDGNDSCMFVTIFLGILDTTTGEVQYANAGHNPPYLLSGGGVTPVRDKITPPLGLMGTIQYPTYSLHLDETATLFLYTDGVTEAMDMQNALFTDARLSALLSGLSLSSAQLVVQSVQTEIDLFAKDAEQHDDITMLCLRRTEYAAKE